MRTPRRRAKPTKAANRAHGGIQIANALTRPSRHSKKTDQVRRDRRQTIPHSAASTVAQNDSATGTHPRADLPASSPNAVQQGKCDNSRILSLPSTLAQQDAATRALPLRFTLDALHRSRCTDYKANS